MSISVNGQSCVPPGFRFHPTEEELLNYYLRKKVASEKIDLDVIRDVDLNKLEPWDIQEKCRIGSTPQNDWYFFSHKDKKYPTGSRTNRATAAGFWKATGRDKVIYANFKRIGMRKTLVFYKGRAPHGQKSDWIMHEYRLDDHSDPNSNSNASGSSIGEAIIHEDGWVVCRVFKKKNHHKAMDSPHNCSSITSDAKTQMNLSGSDDALDQILQYMSRSCKQESEGNNSQNIMSNPNNLSMRYLRPMETILGTGLHERFMKLPALVSPTAQSLPTHYLPPPSDLSSGNQTEHAPETIHAAVNTDSAYYGEAGINDWAALDRLIASHLNGQSEASKQLACFDDPSFNCCSTAKLLGDSQDYHHGGGGSGGDDEDLWSFTQSVSSASDHISHVSL